MQIQTPLDLDYFQEGATTPLLPNPPVLTSHNVGWNNIQLAFHRQPSWEIPEVSGSQHIIVLPGSSHVVDVEFISDGRLQYVQYHPHHSIHGAIEVFPANLPYSVCWSNQVEFTHCYLEPTFLNSIAHETVDPDRVELELELMKADQLIHHLILNLRTELENCETSDRIYIDSIATFLSAHLLRHYTTYQQVLKPYEDGLPKYKLRQAIEYINEHLSETISLTAIADELQMSKYYFCRLFKQSTGLAPYQYLIRQRIQRAKQLLLQSDRNVTDIALDCGFSNQSHLARHFRQFTGMSPQQFRKK
ncbi:helix-turn-helix transcriptional regulator [Oscillatoria sp. FACHB-1407]|uniref:AraC family transcriptional regulator n=1 Tax=Oscillatoria sp. FACHB-1407 TaxID=2692847 RepID=UPI001682123B|nr:AraC family transcriptional regulator [Oscillatoria sp. FACHB-1407]MBD2463793.1 helix-turn-helix transcriptional regulator [Oscillatoria sp. FACHB-1407]